jgi:hypothetical protein
VWSEARLCRKQEILLKNNLKQKEKKKKKPEACLSGKAQAKKVQGLEFKPQHILKNTIK